MAFSVLSAKDSKSEELDYRKAVITVRLRVSEQVAKIAIANLTSERAKLLMGLFNMIRDFENWLYPYMSLDEDYQNKRIPIFNDLKEVLPDLRVANLNSLIDDKTVEELFFDLCMEWLDLIIRKFSSLGLLMPVKVKMDLRTGKVVGGAGHILSSELGEIDSNVS